MLIFPRSCYSSPRSLSPFCENFFYFFPSSVCCFAHVDSPPKTLALLQTNRPIHHWQSLHTARPPARPLANLRLIARLPKGFVGYLIFSHALTRSLKYFPGVSPFSSEPKFFYTHTCRQVRSTPTQTLHRPNNSAAPRITSNPLSKQQHRPSVSRQATAAYYPTPLHAVTDDQEPVSSRLQGGRNYSSPPPLTYILSPSPFRRCDR